MIASFYPKGKNQPYDSCRTDGCSCCSKSFYVLQLCREEILKETQDNIKIAKKVCRYYKIPFEDFCKEVKA